MSIDNVVTFAPRPKPEPTLQYVEVCLNEEDCSLTLTAHDDTGGTVTLEYKLITKSPDNFRLDDLRTAWDVWRGGSTMAS